MSRKNIFILWILLTGTNIFLAFNQHSHSPRYTYHSELWADRAGYFVYLPATFKHGFDPHNFTQGIDSLTGKGFILDTEHRRLITKYTYGVALLQAPVYLIAHVIAGMTKADANSFGAVDHAVVNITGPLFGMWGLWLLFLVLKERFSLKISLLSVCMIYLGTNLFYYTVADPGMSHVYSFFLFTLLLYLIRALSLSNLASIQTWVFIGFAAGLITVIRPTNAIFLLIAPLVYRLISGNRLSYKDLPRRKIGTGLFLAFGAVVVIWLPQTIYWSYAYGTPLKWSYENEGFTNWRSPQLLEFWFAPKNGLFPYTPMVLLMFMGVYGLWNKGHRQYGVAAIASFLIISYLGASWWAWHFGCGFGSRSLVEYWAVFALAIASFLEFSSREWGWKLTISVLVLLAVHQLKMVYSYDGCWHNETWDWQTYLQLLFGPTK